MCPAGAVQTRAGGAYSRREAAVGTCMGSGWDRVSGTGDNTFLTAASRVLFSGALAITGLVPGSRPRAPAAFLPPDRVLGSATRLPMSTRALRGRSSILHAAGPQLSAGTPRLLGAARPCRGERRAVSGTATRVRPGLRAAPRQPER